MAKAQKKHPVLERYRAWLGANAQKVTRQRMVIVSEFLEVDGHISAEDLFRRVKKKAPSTGLASVYRTINSLVEAGIAKERRFLDKSSVYEVAADDHHHDHLICMRCRKIFEFENDEIEKIQSQVAESMGFELKEHKLELYGWCRRPKCPNL